MPIETIFRKIPKSGDTYVWVLQSLFKILGPPQKGSKVVDEDWDFLIILDACRFDYFKKFNIIDGKLEKRISLGTDTPEWIKRNFNAEKYPDIVYVSANPHVSYIKLRKYLGFIPFYFIDEVWDYGWDYRLSSVPPNKVTNAAVRNKKRFPSKRMIIHYLQPHYPPVCFGRTKKIENKESARKQKIIKERDLVQDLVVKGTWAKIRRGEKIDPERVKNEYKENLKLVINEVKRLVKFLEGKIIVTSDHGECLGEWGLWEHYPRVYIKPLLEVPWLEVKK